MKPNSPLSMYLLGAPDNAPMSVAAEQAAGGSEMGSARQIASTARELAELREMTVGELAEKYRQVFGEPTRTRNKPFLRKKIAWRVQELAEGGLSPRALERIEQLAAIVPARWRGLPVKPVASTAAAKAARDTRLPPAGTAIRRVHDGVEHEVLVGEGDFTYAGKQYRSLSAVAREITGTPWNGFLFFFGRGNAR